MAQAAMIARLAKKRPGQVRGPPPYGIHELLVPAVVNLGGAVLAVAMRSDERAADKVLGLIGVGGFRCGPLCASSA